MYFQTDAYLLAALQTPSQLKLSSLKAENIMSLSSESLCCLNSSSEMISCLSCLEICSKIYIFLMVKILNLYCNMQTKEMVYIFETEYEKSYCTVQ